MTRASEIVRARAAKKNSGHWLAAIVGYVVAMVFAVLALLLTDGGFGYAYFAGVAVAATALPAAATLYAMRDSSAEFRAAWLALLAVSLAVWVVGAGWLKRSQGLERVTADVVQADAQADAALAAMDAGHSADAGLAPGEPDSDNPYRLVGYEFKRHHWARIENYRQYQAALRASGWGAMSDAARLYDAKTRADAIAGFAAAEAAVDAWYADERARVMALGKRLDTLSLPETLMGTLRAHVRNDEVSMQALAYSEKLLLYRARDLAQILDSHRWRLDAGAPRFETEVGAYLYDEARALFDRGALNRQMVLAQLHGRHAGRPANAAPRAPGKP